MKNTQTRAFTLVELLITITILALIAVVGYTSFGVRQNNAINSKVTSEIETLTNALLLAKQEKSELPLPKGNLNFFAEDTSYVHNYTDTETFAAHGFITHDTLPKKYIDVLPIDPRTGSFYAYGKTKGTGSLDEMYEIAGVIWKNDTPTSYVTGDYTAEVGPFNLIRSYNGPDFVGDKSDSNFPYNPIERILTAKIDDYSGIVTINGNTYSESKILNFELRTGDTIEVNQDGTVELYFSDGSRSVLGDSTQSTKLTLQKMDYKQENNLVTDVKLILESGMIWNKAASLDEESEFEIYTVDSTAAVRGTIFGIQKNGNDSQIVVKQGSVAVNKNVLPVTRSPGGKIDMVKNAINSDDNGILAQENVANITGITEIDGETILTSNNGSEVGIDISDANYGIFNTGSIDNIPDEIEAEITENYPIFNDNISIGIKDYSYTKNPPNSNININLLVTEKVYKHADVILIKGKGSSIHQYKIIKNIHSLDHSILSDESINIQLKSNTNTHIIDETLIVENDLTSRSVINTNQGESNITEEGWGGENQSFFPSLIPTTHASFESLLDWIESYGIVELEISFGKYTPKGNLRITRPVRLTLIENKDYDNEDEEEKREEEVNDFKREVEKIAKYRDTGCDGFEFTNDNGDDNVCAKYTLDDDSWDLVAYAPYDHAGDIFMYRKGESAVEPTTNAVTSNIISGGNYQKNIGGNSNYNMGILPLFCDDRGLSINKDNSFCINTEGKGIYIDSNGTDDYVKYDFASGLDSYNNYAIEFQVKGSSLERNDNNTHMLYNDGINKIYTYGSTYTKVKHKPSNKYIRVDNIGLSDDQFYKIILTKSFDTFTLKINGIEISNTNAGYISNTLNNNFYVGSSYLDFVYKQQFGDMIDYVKIYSK